MYPNLTNSQLIFATLHAISAVAELLVICIERFPVSRRH